MSESQSPEGVTAVDPSTSVTDSKIDENLSTESSEVSSTVSQEENSNKQQPTKTSYNRNHYNNNNYNTNSRFNKRNSYNGGSSTYNNNTNHSSGQYKNNKYINGNTSYYNNGSGFNKSGMNYNQQNGNIPTANMGWNNYYMQPMYYIPQQMGMTGPNGTTMYMDPNQYIQRNQNQGRRQSMNKNSSSNLEDISSNEQSPNLEKPRTKIEITTKTGEKLNLKKIHDVKTQQHDTETGTDVKSTENQTATDAISKETNINEPEKKDDTITTETEAEKNKKMFLEQVRLRKLALDAKHKSKEILEAEAKAEAKIKEEVKTAINVSEQSETAVEKAVKEVAEQEEENNFEASKDVQEKQLRTTTKHVQIETPSTLSELDSSSIVSQHATTKAVEPETNGVEETKEEASTDSNEDSNRLTITEMLERLKEIPAIENVYDFTYPEPFKPSESQYRKEHLKYTYGPLFLLQFKDRINAIADPAWIESTKSKIVIPVGSNNRMRGRETSKRNQSMRNNDDRMISRDSSRRQSKRFEDRRSNRTSYTSRRDRERGAMNTNRENNSAPEKPKEEVAPFVPTANRWVPKSRQKKTEKKFAPDGVTELLTEEEVISKMKSLLNKLTLEKFDTISTDILAIGNLSKWETKGETLQTVIQQIFNKATDEPYWSSMYAQLCGKLVKELDPEITDEDQQGKSGPKLILHYLVDICHTEFEKGWIDKLPTNEDGSPLEPEMMSDEYYEAAKAKRRGLGLVRFIGFLYRLNLLSGKMMFECFRRLMKDLNDNPSEEVLESVIELLTTVGEQFESDSFNIGKGTLEGSVLLDSLFGLMNNIINEDKVSSRIKFKLVDIKELREDKNWNSEKKNAGPKTIQEIHREDEIARQLKNSRTPTHRRGTNNQYNNNSNYSRQSNYGTNRNRRDAPRDSFTAARTSSTRYNKRSTPTKEEPKSQPVQTNRFSALMHDNDDD
ncbi:hypothetical protein C6P45_002041 [Maudiozyma exigua]|uniref:MIF4G domain-containing protein n=1 Tax=Maudiozyma exigua TaxID=34358 RepID=A0A9P6W0L0_MAUEX|nr:hypothetical protein C6P45_002041 [Kazachstania exigua]